ncbi:hypothetical protein [Prochlorothrix hollandica]|uniref:hypothetical protein n=1 Tax=Prochlorothrix hollandica TaxID=1223 RepID=UPI00034B1999|nr:hypothetical protein [Prochlorothrix hollandica]
MLNLEFQPRVWTSLLLTAFFSFLAPIFLLGGLWIGLYCVGQIIPPLASFTHPALGHLHSFLEIFGNGQPWQGLLTMGSVGAIVGILFDTYALTLSPSSH